ATDTGDASATRLATPPVRALAKQLGVDLRTIARRGETVSRDDVLTLAASVTDSAELDNRVTRIPVRGVRKATAATVSRSAFSAPHVSLWVTVDITETMNVVRRLRGSREWSDVRVNPLLMVARALLFAVRKHPGVNATWDENAQEIVVKHFVNLG